MTERMNQDLSLLAICEALHGAKHGASDPLNAKTASLYLSILRSRLNEWTPSPVFSQRYDDAVKALIEETLAEQER